MQIAIQAALDAASHVVSDERLGEPRTDRELFALLAGRGRIPTELAAAMSDAVSLRNLLVHGYAEIDVELLAGVLATRLGDLVAFAAAMHARVAAG